VLLLCGLAHPRGFASEEGRMQSPKKILTVSHDLELQGARSLVLERANYSVAQATTAEDALRQFSSVVFDLVLICHSVPEASRVEIAASMKARSPHIPVLLLYNSFDRSAALVDAALMNLGTPESLLSIVDLLFARAAQAGSS